YCGRRSNGGFTVWRETAKKRLVAKLHAIKAELCHGRHEPIPTIGAWLQQVTRGYYQYHAIPGNSRPLSLFRRRLALVWRNALRRRSQRGSVSWQRIYALMDRWVPPPHVLHPYPMQRRRQLRPHTVSAAGPTEGGVEKGYDSDGGLGARKEGDVRTLGAGPGRGRRRWKDKGEER